MKKMHSVAPNSTEKSREMRVKKAVKPAIFSRKEAVRTWRLLSEGAKDLEEARHRITPDLRTRYECGWEEIKARFFVRPSGEQNVQYGTLLMDNVLKSLFRCAQDYADISEDVALVAVGGYGRQTLSPFSDIDILFLVSEGAQEKTATAIEYILYALWDSGVKIGHATRTPKEAIKLAADDVSVATSMLDARLVTGSHDLFSQLHHAFERRIRQGNEASYIQDKLLERDTRHSQMGESRYVLEPNIKDGKGGMRDLQTLWWIAKFCYGLQQPAELLTEELLTKQEYRRYVNAERFFFTARAYMHYLTGRAEEVLTFPLQQEIAQVLGYQDRLAQRGVERFMRRYFLTVKDVGALTRTLCAALEVDTRTRGAFSIPEWLRFRRSVDGFRRIGQRLHFTSDAVEDITLHDVFRLFRVAQQHQMDLHPEALRLIGQSLKQIDKAAQRDPELNEIFMDILVQSGPKAGTLRRMADTGVLGKFIPDYGRVVGQMQFDMYHVYTVDEHTINAIGILASIASGALKDELPLASVLIHRIELQRVLYIAVFLHDIAKGRGGNHSVIGEQVAKRLCPRLGMSQSETETVAWLVRHHLLASHTAFKRDLADPKTIDDFLEQVQSIERLKLLLVLTVVDIRAVGPKIWNGWKGSLLRELYSRAAAQLGDDAGSGDMLAQSEAIQQQVAHLLHAWGDADRRAAYLAVPPAAFWLHFTPEQHQQIITLMVRAKSDATSLHYLLFNDDFQSISRFILCTEDQPKLFMRLSGACVSAGISIVRAKIFMLSENMLLYTMSLQNRDRTVLDTRQSKRLIDAVSHAMGDAPEDAALVPAIDRKPTRTRVFTVTPSVIINNHASEDSTVVEVTARDKLGLVHHISQAFAELDVTLCNAHIMTYGEKVNDVFYITERDGSKVLAPERIAAIQEALLTRVV